MCADLKAKFPRLCDEEFCITSPSTPAYNCIAWAAGEDSNWWEPDPYHQHYWPLRNRNSLLQTYIEAFETIGYTTCGMDTSIEPGFEKVAIYAYGFHVTHMARQLISGKWTSKCGKREDIIHHTLSILEGDEYGKVVRIMKRPISAQDDTSTVK